MDVHRRPSVCSPQECVRVKANRLGAGTKTDPLTYLAQAAQAAAEAQARDPLQANKQTSPKAHSLVII